MGPQPRPGYHRHVTVDELDSGQEPPSDRDASRLLKAVESVSISPQDAKKMVAKYRQQLAGSQLSEWELQDRIAAKVVKRYCRLAATTGGATALTGVVPGIGTAVAAVGGGFADAVVCMKLQVDMCMCLAGAYGWDLDGEDARHLAFLIAAGGALEQTGVETATKIASKAGVKLLKKHLKGAVLRAIKEFFKRLGLVFTRKALEKALPLGIGVVLSSSANYALTRYVGNTAKRWFTMERDGRASGSDDEA